MIIYRDYFDSFIGTLKIVANDQFLVSINLAKEIKDCRSNHIVKITKKWLEGYFKKDVPNWIPPLMPYKSSFRQKVINEVLNIPFGKCLSYKDIALRINLPKSYRAVALALKENSYLILVPCHRVVSKRGIGGHSLGVDKKIKLLEFEECESINL